MATRYTLQQKCLLVVGADKGSKHVFVITDHFSNYTLWG